MAVLPLNVRSFSRRIRLVRAWHNLPGGMIAGSVLAGVAHGLDLWTNVVVSPSLGGSVLMAGTLVGVASGFFARLTPMDLYRSLDRRAGLKDRLVTALELAESNDAMANAQRRDAVQVSESLVPGNLYPYRWTRWHTGAVVTLVLALGLQTMAITGYGRSPSQGANQTELANAAVQIRRIERELKQTQAQLPPTDLEGQLAAGMDSLADRLERGKINREDALAEADKLAQKAEDAAKGRAEMAGRHLERAEDIAAQAQQRAFAEAGLREEQARKLDLSTRQKDLLNRLMDAEQFENPPSRFDERTLRAAGLQNADRNLLGLSQQQTAQLRQRLQQEMAEMQRRIDQGAMDPGQRQALKQQAEQLKMNEETRQIVEQLQQGGQTPEQAAQMAQRLLEQNPPMNEALRQALQQMAQQQSLSPEQQQRLAEALQQALENNSLDPQQMQQIQQQLQSSLTPEQIQQMQQQLGDMQQLMESLAASPEVQQAIQRAMQSPQMQEMAQAMQQMRQAQSQLQSGQGLSAEQREQLQEQIQQAASALQDPALRQQFQQQMQQALRQMEAGTMSLEAAEEMMRSLGQQALQDAMQNPQGQGQAGNDQQAGQRGQNLNRSDMPWENLPGNAVRTGVRGERRESDEQEDYIEVRAPAQNSGPSRVPYQKVLPQYRREAEQSMSGNRVPRQYRDRIRQYYDSLQQKK